MGSTTFSGPLESIAGFVTGSAAAPVTLSAAGKLNSTYLTASASTGDTRLRYEKTFFTSTGSGETLRAFSLITGVGAAAAGTINGAHITAEIDSPGTISGACNALRATLGMGAAANPGGTLSAIQVDSDISATATVPTNAAFIRFTNSNTGVLSKLMNVPASMIVVKGSAALSHKIAIVGDDGNTYYIMVSSQ